MIEVFVFFSSLVFSWWMQVGSVFEFPKVILFEIFIFASVLWVLLKNSVNFTKIKAFIVHNRWFIPLFILILLDLLFFQTNTSLFGNPYRLQGIVLLIQLVFFSFLVNIQENHHKNLLDISFFSILILFGLTIVLGYTEESGRYVGTVGNPNALSAVALFSWPYLLTFRKLSSNRLRLFVGIFCVLTLIFLSASRSALIGFFLQISILYLIRRKVSITKSVKISLLLLVLCLVLPLISNSGLLENRAEIWRTAVVSGFTSPIIGHGFGNIEQSLHQTAETLKNNLRFQYVDSSHNILLDWWVQGGIVGLCIILLIIFTTLKNLINHNQIYKIVSFIGILAMFMFNPMSIVNLIQFWWIVGQNNTNSIQP